MFFEDIYLGLNLIAFLAMFVLSFGVYKYVVEKKWPRFFGVFLGVVIFSVAGSLLFFLYISIGFPGWMRWPAQMLTSNTFDGETKRELFVKKGLYSVDITGWNHNNIPNGDIFTCLKCSSLVQVQITYGPELTDQSKYKLNEVFLLELDTKEKQKQFADSILRESIPLNTGFSISIEKVGLEEVGGLKVFEFYAIVKMSSLVSHESTMIAVHKNRIVKITLNYLDGTMNDQVRILINGLYASLKFLN